MKNASSFFPAAPLSSLTDALHRTGVRWQAHREAARLRRTEDPDAHTLADVLAATFSASTDREETAWIQTVEAMRETLRRAKDVVSFRDYGTPSRWTSTTAADDGYHQATRTVQAVCRSSIPAHEGRVLFHLVRRFQPEQGLELGTCLGISAAYTAAALHLNGAGRLVTLEGGDALARLAATHLATLNLHNVDVINGRFADTLPEVLATCDPIGFAFIDGHHDPAALHTYYQQIRPHLADQAVLVFDDIFWTTRMRAAWANLITDRRIRVSVDLLAFGICIYEMDASP